MIRRFALRFGVVLAALFVVPFPLDLIPKTTWLLQKYADFWDWLTRIAAGLVGVEIPPSEPTGSGDTIAATALLVLILVLSVVGAAIWTAIQRDREVSPRILSVTRIALRYWLAEVMLGYGWAKVFKTQFPFPRSARLQESVGDMSPMGLLWTFMGYSTPYNWFSGGMECLGALLLLFRRTTTLGALILIAVLTNVVVLNFCYDVPVKQFSAELLLAAIVLVLPDASRLIAVLFGLSAPATHDDRWLLSPRWRRVAIIVKILAIGSMLYQGISDGLEFRKTIASMKTPLDGIYDVVELTGPPTWAWKKVAIGPMVTVWSKEGDQPVRYAMELGEPGKVKLSANDVTEALTYAQAGDVLIVDGTWATYHLHAVLHRRPPMMLETRGFNWLNEFPFNR